MLNVSDAYKRAIADSHRTSTVRGVLTLNSGEVVNLSDKDIVKDTLYATNQSSNKSDFEYGCVFAGEAGLSFRKNIDRYALYDAKLELYWSLLLADGTWEEIPLGIYWVNESTRVNDKLTVKALDGMTLCDVSVADDTTGTPYDLLTFAAEKCGFELAQTEDEILAFPNGDMLLALYADRVDTYRDLIAFISMLTATFATFDRYGRLKLVAYGTDPVLTLDKKQRFMGASFSDYRTSFIGVEARFIANENYAPYEEYIEGDGLILDMGDIPIVQGLPEQKHACLQAVLGVLQNVRYTPCELQIIPNPAIELGDMIANTNVDRAGNSATSLVTYWYWSYRGKYKLRSIGGNPKLAGVSSRERKQLRDLEASIESKNVVVHSFVNSSDITITGDAEDIILMQYAAAETTTTIFIATVQLEMSLDGYVIIEFLSDNVIMDDQTLTKYLERGEHFVTFHTYLNDTENTRRSLLVRVRTQFFESDTRLAKAESDTHANFLQAIKDTPPYTTTDNIVIFPTYDTGVVDTTVPTCTILANGVHASLYAQGLSGRAAWDGTISISEYVQAVPMSGMSVSGIIESIDVGVQVPTGVVFSENVAPVPMGGMSVSGIIDDVQVGRVAYGYEFSTVLASHYIYNSKYVDISAATFTFAGTFAETSAEEAIDEGRMTVLELNLAAYASIESVVIN